MPVWRRPAPAVAAGEAVNVVPVPAEQQEPAPEAEGPEPMGGPDARFLIDRRHRPRVPLAVRASLAPADDTGAVRPPAIRTRDLSPLGLGFLSRQDLSVLGEAVLRLPGGAGRVVCVACRIRRSRELGNGWYDGLVEFLQPQPELVVEDDHVRLPRAARRQVGEGRS
jgi:hypothetical protein